MKKLLTYVLILFSISLFISSCQPKEESPSTAKTFVLVHGAWQAAYVWDSVKAELTKQGHKVIVVELPAHGDDTTSPTRVNMTAYRDKVIAAMSGIDSTVILVGHSMGGFVVSAVAEAVPSKIEKLVYIGAFVPANGQTLGYLSSLDKQSHLNKAVMPADSGATLNILRDSIVPVFCQDAPVATQQLVLSKFRPEPARPFGDTAKLSAANWGKVNKYYIHTTLDNAISLDWQNRMVATANITNVYSLPTGHCPFLSKPDEVAKLLLQIAK